MFFKLILNNLTNLQNYYILKWLFVKIYVVEQTNTF